jgi:hypothetical protein
VNGSPDRNRREAIRESFCKPDAFFTQCVYTGRFYPAVAIDPDMVGSEIVQHDHDDIHSIVSRH